MATTGRRLLAEPPIADDTDAYRDEELKSSGDRTPRTGQHRPRTERRIPRRTKREPRLDHRDLVSTKLAIQSWRWAGVPFHVRTGKCMPGSPTEAVIELHRPPRLLFAGQSAARPEANLIRFRLGHNDGLTMSPQAKAPGALTLTQPVDLNVDSAAALGHRQEAHERLLDDAMDGRRHRFAREDTIEEEWRIVEPILDHSDRPRPLLPRHLGPGPSGADALTGEGTTFPSNRQPETRRPSRADPRASTTRLPDSECAHCFS